MGTRQWLPALGLAWSWPAAGSGDPAAQGLVPAVVRRLEEHRLAELVVAAVAGDQDVAHAAAAAGGFASGLAQARFPAHLRPAGPQLMTEWAVFGLVLEHRDGHLNDHALTSSYASMVIVNGIRHLMFKSVASAWQRARRTRGDDASRPENDGNSRCPL